MSAFCADLEINTGLAVFTTFSTNYLILIQVKPIRAGGNTAMGYFIQVVARFTGHALVIMASKTGFTTG